MPNTIRLPQSAISTGGSPLKWLGLLDVSGRRPAAARASIDSGSAGSAGMTNVLKASGFSPAVPEGVTITGLSLRIRRAQEPGLGTISDTTVTLAKADGTVSQNKSAGAAWSTVLGDVVFGGAGDLWGFASLTPSDVNHPAFTASLAAMFVLPSGSLAGRVELMEFTVHHL